MALINMVIPRTVVFSCIIGLLGATLSSEANANYTKRSDKWEASFKVLNNQSTSIDGQNGSNTSMKSDYGWGLLLVTM